MYNILDFGAVPDGKTINTHAIQKAIDACAVTGGTVVVPEGSFVTGTLWLKSNVELHLCHGAMLKASKNLDDYNDEDAYRQNFAYKKEEWCAKHLIIALECKNTAITGTGTIDGSGDFFYDKPDFFGYYLWADGLALSKDKENLRPGQLVNFIECENIHISDITIRNATSWDIFLYGCKYANIRGVKIFNPSTYANTDGINIDLCSYVTVSDCIIDTGDDAIAIRCNDKFLENKNLVTEYITVSNCILGSSSSVFRIGIGRGTIRNVNVSDIQITRGSVGMFLMISPLNLYSAHFQNIHFSGITADNICYPFVIEGTSGIAEKISIRDFYAEASAASKIISDDDCTINDVVLENINIEISEKYPELTADILHERGDIVLDIRGVKNLSHANVRAQLPDGNNKTWKKIINIQNKF